MSVPLRLINLLLRLNTKRMLARMRDPSRLRRNFEFTARIALHAPRDSRFSEVEIPRTPTGALPALWVECGRPTSGRTILFLHGGAFVAGSPRTHRHVAAAIARAASARVLVPDYRLAPDHPFPAAVEDAADAYAWLCARISRPKAIGLAGDSAGGGLVFSTVLRTAAQGLPPPACSVAFSPWADMRGVNRSLQDNAASDVMLPAHRMPDVVATYLSGATADDPLASPVLGRFRDPPPALIMASQAEILRDDALGIARALRESGGDVRLEIWRGVPHAWPIFAGLMPEADRAIEIAGAFLRQHLQTGSDDTADAAGASLTR
ncbi:MAG: alpha/beta hydrolase [Pseudomonadota bacterium]